VGCFDGQYAFEVFQIAQALGATLTIQITTAADAEYATHHFERVVVAMLAGSRALHLDSLAKYAAAFFRISRSILAMASSRSSSLIRSWSALSLSTPWLPLS
jgi:hypothetical protein